MIHLKRRKNEAFKSPSRWFLKQRATVQALLHTHAHTQQATNNRVHALSFVSLIKRELRAAQGAAP